MSKLGEKTVFLDENHAIVSESKARWKVTHKYDEKGELAEEEWVDLKTKEVKEQR